MTNLNKRQKELFQEDKRILIDTIVILENRVNKLVSEIEFLNNELLLNAEALKNRASILEEELELERNTREKLEKGYIEAQEEIDMTEVAKNALNPMSKFDKDALLHKLQNSIHEEGEDGVL